MSHEQKHETVNEQHRIIEQLRSEKTLKIINSVILQKTLRAPYNNATLQTPIILHNKIEVHSLLIYSPYLPFS